ncbi:cell division protein FtsL [Paracoccus sp. JM45]|uniref:cell division protein FtsL n=1 Tax=Paracoccus sp. JM45 TaxID=2283626 RepID=UPI000E6CC406|nr:cell division protein FtsL [Paracoccus sp. JM45]RJE80684.1 cell division protein FtsL [Paracoccus sp. JM45]
MRSLSYFAGILVVMGLAFWAYRENYATQASIGEMAQVQRQIAGLREELGVMRAEWAYLNRPERLRELVDLNFERLQLVPVDMGQFVDLNNIDYPKPPPPVDPLVVLQGVTPEAKP